MSDVGLRFPWGSFPTDVTSPMPTQIHEPSPDTQRVQPDPTPERPAPQVDNGEQ